jgi:3' terminal RNA ribose 2'-O-methyltransferase Hen1
MLLQISTTHSPATDLGFLLAKNPERVQSFNLSFGRAHAFYPHATEEICTFALLLDVDTVALSRGKNSKKRGEQGPLQPYVNDRAYVASSFLSVAIAQVLRSGLSGASKERPELAQTPIPLEAQISAVPCGANGEDLLRRLFEPLGYLVESEGALVDERFSDWGASPTRDLKLRQTIRLSDLLAHLYVLIPVLDDEKHYYVGDDEVEKLLKRSEGWLESHPERELIVSRYLKRRRALVDEAFAPTRA